MAKIQEIIEFVFNVNTKSVDKALDKTKNKAEKTGDALDKSGKKLGKVFANIGKILTGGAIALGAKQIFQFGKQVIQTTIKLEAFERRAKIVFGSSFPGIEREARKTAASLGLSRTAFIGLTSATGDLLIPMGASREEAAKIGVQALKTAAALKEFSGTTRTTAEISEVVTKAFLGEFESLKLLGISIREKEVLDRLAAKGIKGLTGTVLQLAKAREIELIITEKSADAQKAFAENTDSLQRSYGKLTASIDNVTESLTRTLGEALAPFVEGLIVVADGLDSFLTGLTAAGRQSVVLGGLLTALGLVMAFVFGPIGLIIAGVAAAVTVLFTVFSELNPTLDDTRKKFRSQKSALADIKKEMKAGILVAKDYVKSSSKLAEISDELGVSLRKQNGHLKTNAQLLRDNIAATNTLQLAKLNILRVEALDRIVFLQRKKERVEKRVAKGFQTPAGLVRVKRRIQEAVDKLTEISQDIFDINNPPLRATARAATAVATAISSIGKAAKRSDFLSSNFIKSLKALRKERDEFLKLTKSKKQKAEAGNVFLQREKQLINAQLIAQADFLDDKLKAELIEIDARFVAEIQRLEDFHKIALKAEKGNLAARLKLSEDFNKKLDVAQSKREEKKNKAELGAVQEKISRVSDIAGGVGDIVSGVRAGVFSGGFVQTLGGVGQVVGGQEGAVIGQAAGIFGTLGGIFESIFDNTEKLRFQEELRQSQIEVTNKLIEQQRDLQKQLIELEQRRVEIADKVATRQIQLNNILISDAKERDKANQLVRREQIERESKRAGFTGDFEQVAQDIVGQTKSEQRQVLDVSFLVAQSRAADDLLASSVGKKFNPADLFFLYRDYRDILVDAKSGVKNFSSLPSSVQGFFRDKISNIEAAMSRVESNLGAKAIIIRSTSGITTAPLENILDVLQFDVGRNDQLLALIDQFTQSRVPPEVEAKFNLLKAREQSFVDVGRGGIREAFGIFRAPQVNLAALDVPTGIQAVSLAQKATRSFSERQADTLEDIAAILQDSLETLLVIADNTGEANRTEAEKDLEIADIFDRISDRQISEAA